MKVDKFVIRVPEHYIDDDGLQIMYSYTNRMALIGEQDIGIKYLDWPEQDIVNSYLDDKKREKFPYGNIPIHVGTALFHRNTFANQILLYEHQYLSFRDGAIIYDFPIKNGDKGLIVRCLPILDTSKHREITMSYEELQKIYSAKHGMVEICDSKRFCREIILWDNQHFLDVYKAKLKKEIDKLDDENILRNSIELDKIDKLPTNGFELSFVPNILLSINSNGDIDFTVVKHSSRDGVTFNVTFDSYFLPKHTLSSLQDAKFVDAKEPKIPTGLNPNIPIDEVKRAKQLVLTRKR